MADPKPSLESLTLKAHAAGLNFHYGDFHALKNIEMPIHDKRVTALIGPSGCGKSTFLRCFNRMHDLYPGNRYEGEIRLHPDDVNLLDRAVDPIEVRMRLSMVFQKPNPFPKTIFENVAYGLRVRGLSRRAVLEEKVEEALRGAALWNEVKDRLHHDGGALSGGQQQRLCIARSLAVDPDVLLMDEPCSALDPTSTRRIEDTIGELRSEVTIVIVTHNMQQAARVSQQSAFFLAEQGTPGGIVEAGPTEKIFNDPVDPRTSDYVHGRFG